MFSEFTLEWLSRLAHEIEELQRIKLNKELGIAVSEDLEVNFWLSQQWFFFRESEIVTSKIKLTVQSISDPNTPLSYISFDDERLVRTVDFTVAYYCGAFSTRALFVFGNKREIKNKKIIGSLSLDK